MLSLVSSVSKDTLFSHIISSNYIDGRKRRKKDPNKPKRAATGYTLFVSENYESMKRNNDPALAGKDIITMIARQWEATSPEEKEVSMICREMVFPIVS